jgi:hypothetical protein
MVRECPSGQGRGIVNEQDQERQRQRKITLFGAMLAACLAVLAASLFQPALAQIVDLLP